MSRIQAALDQADQPELSQSAQPDAQPEVVKIPKPAMATIDLVGTADLKHTEPRLNAIRFYEGQNAAVEEAIKKQTAGDLTSRENSSGLSDGKKYLLPIGVLLIVSLIGSRFFIGAERSVSSHDSASSASVPVQAVSAAVPPPQPVVVQSKSIFSAKPTAKVKFLLTGITSADGVLLALINNQVVGSGDRLREGAVVKSITAQQVVLEFQGKEVRLNF